MARPLKEGLEYFYHDTDAVTDEKIEAMRTLYRNDAYAFYFILLERIYRSNNTELDLSDKETCKILAKKIMVSVSKFNNMVSSAIKWGLFDKEAFSARTVLTSSGIQKRAKMVLNKRTEARDYYKNHPKSQPQNQREPITNPETHQETNPETHQETNPETHQETNPESTISKESISKDNINISKESKEAEFKKIVKLAIDEYKVALSPLVRIQLDDILEEYGYDIFYAATKKVAGTAKCKLNYIQPILEEYKLNGIPNSNGKKPQLNKKNDTYQIPTIPYKDMTTYGK